MATSTIEKIWTSEDLEQFPDDGVERWIDRGRLVEFPSGEDMSLCSPIHGSVVIATGTVLRVWSRSRPAPRPCVYGGDIFCKFRNEPDTNAGIDIVVVAPEQAAEITADSRFIEGPPLLAIEIVSASDTMKKISSKTKLYLEHGTPLVWLVDPFDRSVTVYRPGTPPVLFNSGHELTAEPELPGFRCRVSELFE